MQNQVYNPNLPNKIFLLFIYFIYMFSLSFIFIPAGIGTRALLGVIGLVLLFVHKLDFIQHCIKTNSFPVNKNQALILGSIIAFTLSAFFSNLINGTQEKSFITYPISIILIFSGAYLVTSITRKIYKRVNYEIIANYIIAITLLQIYISLIMFFIPTIKIGLTTIINMGDTTLEMMLREDGFRLMGLGIQFFGAGIINSFVLLLIMVLLRQHNTTFARTLYLTFAFISIFSFGMMMARTTLVGLGFAGIYFVLSGNKSFQINKLYKKLVLSLTIIVSTIFIFIGTLSSDNKDMMVTASEYGFEMFVNYFDEGEASTASTDRLKEMHQVIPTDLSTWVTGDGYFEHPTQKESYYMYTDVGYTRLIFYCGIIGLILYLFYQYTLAKSANSQTEGKYKLFWIITYLLFLTLMLKGLTELLSLYAPFLFITSIFNKNTARVQN